MKIKIWLFLALAICTIFLFSCNNSKNDIVQNGILIENTASISYSQKTNEYARDVIFSLLEHYTKKISTPNLQQATIDKLRGESEKIQNITKKSPLNEEQYIKIFEILSKNGKATIDEALTASSYESIRTLYKELSKITGAEYVGSTLYFFSLYRYDYTYEESIKNYEKYGYTFLLEDAQRALENKAVLENEIGRLNFVNATDAMFFITELFIGEAYKESTLSSFTSEEVLILLKHLGFSLNGMSSKGWELLLSLIPSSSEGDYLSRLLNRAKENGDLTIIAENMNEIFSFFGILQENLTIRDAEYVKNLSYEELISSMLGGLDDNGWATFECITTMTINNDDYAEIARQMYGDIYDSYISNVSTYTLNQLKESVKEGSPIKTLEGYLVGAFPALGYLLYD